MSNPTLASITAELEAVETAARGRGSLTCDHLAGRIANIRGELQQIAQPQPPAEAQAVKGAPIRYFAYDSDCGDYNEFDTLPEAIADAQEALDYAGDDGWPEGGPSIYYGAVLGEAREVEGSRRPAGPGDHPDADFIVEYELTGSDALAQQPAAVDGAWLVKARELYYRCCLYPEKTTDGLMALLELRNHVHSILAAQQGERA